MRLLCNRIGFEASLPVIAVQIRGHDDGRQSCCRRAEQSQLLAMVVVGVVAARRRRRPTRMTPQRCGCCERGGEERQERRASKMKVAARTHQVIITILHRALAALGQRLWPRRHTIPRQNVTTIQRTPQINFSKNREKRMEPKEVAPDSEMGRRPI